MLLVERGLFHQHSEIVFADAIGTQRRNLQLLAKFAIQATPSGGYGMGLSS